MTPRQDGSKGEHEMRSGESWAEYFNGKQGNALEENQRPSEVANAAEASWRAFIRDMKTPHLSFQHDEPGKQPSGQKAPAGPVGHH